MILKACAVNLVTPFTDTNEIDFSVLEKIIEELHTIIDNNGNK